MFFCFGFVDLECSWMTTYSQIYIYIYPANRDPKFSSGMRTNPGYSCKMGKPRVSRENPGYSFNLPAEVKLIEFLWLNNPGGYPISVFVPVRSIDMVC